MGGKSIYGNPVSLWLPTKYQQAPKLLGIGAFNLASRRQENLFIPELLLPPFCSHISRGHQKAFRRVREPIVLWDEIDVM